MSDFVFADDYRLGQNPARQFFEAFLKGYVHKHNNLMGVIQGFTSLILYEDGVGDDLRENAEQIQISSKSATELNREVLSASGCGRCDLGTIRLTDVIPYWQSKGAEICGDAGVDLRFQASDTLPPVTADAKRLGEVFFHLLRNAAEATAAFPGSPVVVDLLSPGQASDLGTVDLLIRNRSADFSPEALAKMFIPFESSKGIDHFGIGLTAAAVMAGDLGARLGLRSTEGTMTAWLAIPVAA